LEEGGIDAGLVQRAGLDVHQRDRRRHTTTVTLWPRRWRAMAGIW
jgi:hypothetical protein